MTRILIFIILGLTRTSCK